MQTLDLSMEPAPGLALLPVVGPDAGRRVASCHLILCLLCADGSHPFHPPANTAEQVFYVIAGHGILRQGQHRRQLKPLQAYRLAAGAPVELERHGTAALQLLYLASPLSPVPESAGAASLAEMEGIAFPAARWGRSITNGGSPLKSAGFTAGLSILAPGGGQVPWHNHPDRQHEVYLLLGGRPQMCIGAEMRELAPPCAAFIPGDQWHQLTNLHAQAPLPLIYCYAGNVAAPHWWQERDGVLPPAGVSGNPPLPTAAFPQCLETSTAAWERRATAHLKAESGGD